MRTHLTCVVIVTVASLPLGTSAALADATYPDTSPGPQAQAEITAGTPTVMVAVDRNGQTLNQRAYGSGGSGPAMVCHYYEIGAALGSSPSPAVNTAKGPIVPEIGQTVALDCYAPGGQLVRQFIDYDPATPFGPVALGEDAAAIAREQLPLAEPEVITSPPAGRPQLAGLETWLSVDTVWQPVSASATLGGVTATVTATPEQVVWDPGDGSGSITCRGPGAVFDPGDPEAGSDCTHTYVDATGPGESLALTATVTWSVAWTATDGTGDALDPVTRATTVAVTVDQAQAVIR